MNKIVQALLTGMFITFFLDFFIFLGIFLNYIELHGIDVYYNILFADHQNLYIFFVMSIFFGYISVYIKNYKISLTIIGFFGVVALSTLLQGIGESLGESMLMTKNSTLKSAKHTFIGDIYYEGREYITFYDREINKMIKIDKKDLK